MKPTGKTPSEKIKRFFEEKDWKFYCAILGGIALVGGGYYITCSKEPKCKAVYEWIT
jgi:import receptor subunit TOM70